VLRRSPKSSSTSPFKELTRGASNRRHRRGYLAGNELLHHRNSSTLAKATSPVGSWWAPGPASPFLPPSSTL
jgi:hypothetical protein